MNKTHVAQFLGEFTAWAATQDQVQGVALVGSYARGTATDTSDVDLVVLANDPQSYRGVVLESGRMADVEVVEFLDPELDQETVAAFRQWEFKPATKHGTPVAVRITCRMILAFKD